MFPELLRLAREPEREAPFSKAGQDPRLPLVYRVDRSRIAAQQLRD